MNRRDTIIIAVLINAGLLAVLFVMAINNDDYSVSNMQGELSTIVDVTEQSTNPTFNITATTPLQQESFQSGDELDYALKQYANEPELILVDDENEPTEIKPVEPPPAITTTPPQNPEPHPSTPPHYVDITVKKGDALEKIARANNTTVDAIKKANDLTSNKLNIGQVLKVPVNTKKASTSTANNTSSKDQQNTEKEARKIASTDPEYYVIKSGDNPWKIAKQFHVKFDDLLKLNNLDEEKARNLKIGDKIRVK